MAPSGNRRKRLKMVQTSDEQSRKADGKIRKGGIEYPWKMGDYIESNEHQKHRGWFWCSEKKAFFRYSDWNKPVTDFI